MTRLTTFMVVALLAACSKPPPEPEKVKADEPAKSAAPTVTSAAAAPQAKPSAAGPADVAYDAPAAWPTAPNPSSMRKATFKVPKAAGDSEDGELSVSTASGGVDANIGRWAGQFANATPKKEQRSPNGLKVTVVELAGTFSGGGMMGAPAAPKEHWMMLGAVVEGAEGQLHFFKLTGPEKTVQAAKKDFDTFVASFRAK